MFQFHIYLGDTCLGSVEAHSPGNAITMYCLRTGISKAGLTAVLVLSSVLDPNFVVPNYWPTVGERRGPIGWTPQEILRNEG